MTPGSPEYTQYQAYNQQYGLPTTAQGWDTAFLGNAATWAPPPPSNAADSYSSAPTALETQGQGVNSAEFGDLFNAQDPYNINGTTPVSFPDNSLISGFDEAYAPQIATDIAAENTYAGQQQAYDTASNAYNAALAVTNSAGAADQAAQTAWQNYLTQYDQIENPVAKVNYGLGAFQNGVWGGASSSGWTNGAMADALLQLEGEAVGASYPGFTPVELASPAYAAASAKNPGTINTLEASLPALVSAAQGLVNNAGIPPAELAQLNSFNPGLGVQAAAEAAQAALLGGDLNTYESGLAQQQAADYANAKQYQLAQINLGLGLSSGAASGPIGTPLTFNDASAGSGSGGFTVAQAPEAPVSPADPSNAEIGGVFGGGTGLFGGPNGAFTSGSGSVNIGADNIGDFSGFSPSASAPFVGDASNIGFGQGTTPTVDIGTPVEAPADTTTSGDTSGLPSGVFGGNVAESFGQNTSPVQFSTDGTPGYTPPPTAPFALPPSSTAPGELSYDPATGLPIPGYTPPPDTTPDTATLFGAYGGGPASYPVAPVNESTFATYAPLPQETFAPSLDQTFSAQPPVPYLDLTGQAPFGEAQTAAAPFDPSAFTGAYGGGSPDEQPFSASDWSSPNINDLTATNVQTFAQKMADAISHGGTIVDLAKALNTDPAMIAKMVAWIDSWGNIPAHSGAQIDPSQPLAPQLQSILGNVAYNKMTEGMATGYGGNPPVTLAQVEQALSNPQPQVTFTGSPNTVADISSDGNTLYDPGPAPDPYSGGLLPGSQPGQLSTGAPQGYTPPPQADLGGLSPPTPPADIPSAPSSWDGAFSGPAVPVDSSYSGPPTTAPPPVGAMPVATPISFSDLTGQAPQADMAPYTPAPQIATPFDAQASSPVWAPPPPETYAPSFSDAWGSQPPGPVDQTVWSQQPGVFGPQQDPMGAVDALFPADNAAPAMTPTDTLYGDVPLQPGQYIDYSSLISQIYANLNKLTWMEQGETGARSQDVTKEAIVQTALNRALERGQPLSQILLSGAQAIQQGLPWTAGYYASPTQGGPNGPPVPGGGTYGPGSQPTQAQVDYFTNTILPAVLSGQNYANIPGYGPATGNASAGVAANTRASGTPNAIIPGGVEGIFQQGPLNYGLPTYTPSWYGGILGAVR